MTDFKTDRRTPLYYDDFRNFFFNEERELESVSRPSLLPEHIEDYATINAAVRFFQRSSRSIGGMHRLANDYDHLCLKVIKTALSEYGELFPVLYRGENNVFPEAGRIIWYASTDKSVAEFYGEVEVLTNIRGLRTFSVNKSVKEEDPYATDEEIIFFR